MYPIPPGEHLAENRTCKQCSSIFSITDKDMGFYEKISPSFPSGGVPTLGGRVEVSEESKHYPPGSPLERGVQKYLIPPPTLCPDCRQQRRLAFRNERKLYKRKCDATGKETISIYSPDKPYIVYHGDYWWSDAWDPMKYEREFDFSRSAMEQFGELLKEVPKLALSVEKQENSDYTNYAGWNKDCYLIFLGANNENCYYCSGVWDSTNTVDTNNSKGIQESYMLTDCSNCYHCTSLQNAHDCTECHTGMNLTNCKHCLFSLDLTDQEFCILNKKVSKVQYENVLADVNLMEKLKHEYDRLGDTFPQRENRNFATENCSGNNLAYCANVFSSFDVTNSKDCKYVGWMFDSKDCYDVYDWGAPAEMCYECHKVGDNASHLRFSAFCLSQVSDLLYCYDCVNGTKNCFLSVGLKGKSYCILNRQYTIEEYEVLVPRIIEKMMRDGAWGEFFPASLSPFGYNETVAQEYFPMKREEVLGNSPLEGLGVEVLGSEIPLTPFLKGEIFNWSDYEAPFPKVEKVIPASKLPDHITKIPDDILNWVIECEVSGKPFRIIKQELEFYRKHNLPIPRRHPDVRHMDRMKLRNPRKLFERVCDCESCEENNRKVQSAQKSGHIEEVPFLTNPRTGKTGRKMITTYSPARLERVYCEECYNGEVAG